METILVAYQMAERMIEVFRANGSDSAVPDDGSLQEWVAEAWDFEDEHAQDVDHWVECWVELIQGP